MVIAIIFLPGIMGSTLFDGSDQIWPSKRVILFGPGSAFADRFKDPSFPLDPGGVMQEDDLKLCGISLTSGYTKTREFFSRNGFTILEKKTGWSIPAGSPNDKLFFEYPYDWRLDLRKTADLLHTFIQNTVLALGAEIEIYLVGHSMGGLLSRTYLMKYYHPPFILPNIKKQILIGTPNHGSVKAYHILRDGRGLLSYGPLFRNYPRKLNVLAHDLPGIYQLLPSEEYQNNFFVYDPIVFVGNKYETSIQGTYIASKSTIYPSSEGQSPAQQASKAKRALCVR